MKWNRAFTDLIRDSRPTHWGNWALDPNIKAGAVGTISQDGDFTLANQGVPGVSPITRSISNEWKLSSKNVRRKENKVALEGNTLDPSTGTKINAGVEVKWDFSSEGSIASEFSIASESVITLDQLSRPETIKWLADQAQKAGMGHKGTISQGFGVITSVILANSGVNVGADESGSSFSITGSVGAVHALLGGGSGKGSFVKTQHQKKVDQHTWPTSAQQLAHLPVPIAYRFTSFDGSLLIPNWISRVGALQICFNSKFGSTYAVKIELQYDTPHSGRHKEGFTVTGGLSKTVGNIPLAATNVQANLEFVNLGKNEQHAFHWDTPLAQWPGGKVEIQMDGVWPFKTTAVEK